MAAAAEASDEKKAENASLIVKPSDTTGKAKKGGVMKWFSPNEPAHFDINQGLAPLNTPNNLQNSLLVNERPGLNGKAPEYSEVVPDLAESWEWSPDKTSLTVKLRSGIKWHNKAPVNGRAFTTEDIVFSWNRFAAKSQGRGNLANSANPNAPVLSVTATDDRTIVFKLKEPLVYFLSQLTPGQTGSFQMLPKEADTGYDPRKEIIGTGPLHHDQIHALAGLHLHQEPGLLGRQERAARPGRLPDRRSSTRSSWPSSRPATSTR